MAAQFRSNARTVFNFMRLPDWKALFRKWDRERRMPSVEAAIGVFPQNLPPPDRHQLLAWLGQWRDDLKPEAVSDLQDILGVPKQFMSGNLPSDYKMAALAKEAGKAGLSPRQELRICGGHCRICEGVYMPERRGQRNVCVCSECGDWFEAG